MLFVRLSAMGLIQIYAEKSSIFLIVVYLQWGYPKNPHYVSIAYSILKGLKNLHYDSTDYLIFMGLKNPMLNHCHNIID